MPVSKLDAIVSRIADDNRITRTEARSLIKEAKAGGSKKPIDDVFQAVDRSRASIDASATRLILSELDQKMTRATWLRYVQRAVSVAGGWSPGTEGSTLVKRKDLPPSLQRIFDEWAKHESSKPQVFAFDIAGNPAYLMQQDGDFGTGVALFDAGGKSIELKEDTENIRRNARRIQAAYDQYFRSPALKSWKNAVTHTDLGVAHDYHSVGTYLDARAMNTALTPEMKRMIADHERPIKNAQTNVYRNKSDGSFLAITQNRNRSGPAHYALFSKTGVLKTRFVVDV